VQRELEKARRLETLGRFAAGIAHEFNNSLSVIGSSVELLHMDAQLSDPSRALLDEIAESTRNGASTVRQLLSLGRSDAGQPEAVQLAELLRRSVSTLRSAVGERVKLELEMESQAHAHVDAGQLRQALLNLALNARDAMPDGGQLRLRLYEREVTSIPRDSNAQPGKYLTLDCRDDGVGIAPELLDKIFEPFFTTKSVQEGSGLGLAMVRKAIHDAAGFIEVSSRPGAGTTFSLNLPLHVPAPASDGPQPTAATHVHASKPS